MTDPPRRPRRALWRLAVSCGTLLVALVAVDIWVGRHYLEGDKYNWVQLPPYSALPEQVREKIAERAEQFAKHDREKALGAFDAHLGWDYVQGRGWKGRDQLSINSIGARGAHEFDAEPDPARVRIACFGESYTYGTEVLDGEDWPAKVTRIDERFEMINMGVGGYGTDQVLLRMRRDLAGLAARGVVIGYMLENCLRNVNRWRTRLYVETAMPVVKPRFIFDANGALELVPQPYATRVEAYRAAVSGELAEALAPHEFWSDDVPLLPFSNLSKLLTARRALARREWPQYYDDLGSEPMQITLALLEACYREALASGAEHALVLVYPSRTDLRSVRDGAEPYWADFLDDLRGRGVEVEDAMEWLKHRTGRMYGDAHFNAKGNDTVAEGVWLWASEVFPE